MLKGFKRAQKIVSEAAVKRYDLESPDAQLRHIRIHIAAQASQISSILTETSMLRALLSQHNKNIADVLADIGGLLERLREGRDDTNKDLNDLHRYVRAMGPTLHSLDEKVTGLRPACEHAPDGGNHPEAAQ